MYICVYIYIYIYEFSVFVTDETLHGMTEHTSPACTYVALTGLATTSFEGGISNGTKSSEHCTARRPACLGFDSLL